MLYIDLLLSEFGLYQTLNSEDNAREACMGSWFLDVRFTWYLSTLRELSQLCSYTRWQILEILFDYCKWPSSQDIEQKKLLTFFLNQFLLAFIGWKWPFRVDFSTWISEWISCIKRSENFTHKQWRLKKSIQLFIGNWHVNLEPARWHESACNAGH